MSAVSSPPAADGHHHRLTGVKDQTLTDPFLPPSPNEEQLLRLPSSIAASAVQESQTTYQLTHSPTGQPAQITSDISHPPPASSSSSYSYPHRSFAVHDQLIRRSGKSTDPTAPSVHSQHHSASLSPASGSDFLSPTAVYSEFSEITTPSFDDEFYLEANFGPIPAIEPEDDIQYSINSYGISSQDPLASKAQSPSHVGHKQRPSLGRADNSSLLLSPVLTNTPSPPQRAEQYRHLDMGPTSISAGVTSPLPSEDLAETPTRMEMPAAEPQHTPALTGSPSDVSLEVEPGKPIARAASPIVRVESYSRGDSPARAGLLGRNSSKRSRASRSSVHLSPYDEAESSEGEVEDDQHNQQIRCSEVSPSALRNHDGLTASSAATGRRGVNPDMRSHINEAPVPNLQEQEEHRHIAERNADVEDWLARSEAGSEIEGDQPSRARSRTFKALDKRRRAKSMGDYSAPRADALILEEIGYDDSGIPGPGLLLDEESGEEDDESEDTGDEMPESPPAVIDKHTIAEEGTKSYFPTVDEEPLARQFYRSRPWQDPPFDPGVQGMKIQPATSNAAIMRFKQRADNVETASRAATWGTRRLSEADIDKLVGDGGLLKRLSFGKEKDKSKGKGERRGSFLEQAATKLLPKRGNSNHRRKTIPQTRQSPSSETVEKSRKESLGNPAPSKLGKKPKNPMPTTGSAVAAMAGQIAAIGGSGSISATAAAAPHGPWTHAKSVIKRTRSRSELGDINKGAAANLGLAGLMTQHGGPPMPTLASPPKENPYAKSFGPPGDEEDEEAEEAEEAEREDEVMDDKGVIMDLKMRADEINPTSEGFKSNVRQLNPRLVPFLVDRIGQEQVRRYKKLIEFKIQHLNAVSNGSCTSGKHCFALAGEASVLPRKASTKDPEVSYAELQVTTTGASDDESSAFGEGTVTATQFPPGVPLPPVKRLPTEFECPLCFKVKKFQKPSDWTKHVHEDVQPFTCTFPNCAEPKSFKRKADWVRHENERHRQLEWWTCNMPDCSHTCYRKDNFVQHLVREHKKPEPKVKASKGPTKGPASGKARVARSQMEVIEDWKAAIPGSPDPAQDEVDKVWALVEDCRHDTRKLPREEACKFCGNVCNSWKKLTVHLAKHMEQISMPVLRLVEQKAVTLDTIVSPVEQRVPQQRQSSSPMRPLPMLKFEPLCTSPYGIPANVTPEAGNLSGPFGMHNPGAYYGPTSAAQVQAMKTYVAGQAGGYSARAPLPTSIADYPEDRNPALSMPSYQSYEELPQRQFVTINAAQEFTGTPTGQGRGDYEMMSGPISRPTTSYSSADPSMAYYDRQQAFPSPMEGGPFLYSNTGGTAQVPAMGTAVPMQYDPITGVSYTQAPSCSSSAYLPSPQNYPYRQQ